MTAAWPNGDKVIVEGVEKSIRQLRVYKIQILREQVRNGTLIRYS